MFERLTSRLWAEQIHEDDTDDVTRQDEEPEWPTTVRQTDGTSHDSNEHHEPLATGEECASNVSILEWCDFTTVEEFVCLPAESLDEHDEEHYDDGSPELPSTASGVERDEDDKKNR